MVASTAIIPCSDFASAQETDPRSAARIHAGPLHLSPGVTLQDVGVDSNIFNTPSDARSDFTFTVRPTVDLITGVRKATLTVRSVTDFVYFATHQSERSVNSDVAVIGRVPLRRLALFSRMYYRNSRQRIGDEIDARSRQMELTGEAEIRMSLSPRLSAHVGGRQSRLEFDPGATFDDTALAEILNRRERSVDAAVRYALTPLTTLIATVNIGAMDFPLSPSRDSETWRPAVGVEFNPRALVSGAATIGYQRFRSRTGLLPEFTGLAGSANLSYRTPGDMVLGLSLDRNLFYSYFQDTPYFVQEAFRVSLRRHLIQRVDVDVSSRRSWHRYRRAGGGSADAIEGPTETIREDSAGLIYSLSPRTSMRVALSYWRRRSDENDYRNFNGFRSGATFAYVF